MQIEITDINDAGEGIGRQENKVVFVAGAVPEDIVTVKILQQKSNFIQAELVEIIQPSPHRIKPHCIVADKCGGCQWQFLSYAQQLVIKHRKVRETLVRIGKFTPTEIDSVLLPIIPADQPFGYRNKVAFPLGIGQNGTVKAGYFQRNSHKLINLNKCPVQEDRFNIFLQQIKQDIQRQKWSVYNEVTHRGSLRHLLLRIGRRRGEILLTLVSKDAKLENLSRQAEQWLTTYRGLVGVTLNINPHRTNAILGTETKLIAGQDFVTEKLLSYTFHLRADTFFQVYTEQAEKMIQWLRDHLSLTSTTVLLDAYGGIGTIAICLANLVKQVVAIEIQPQAVKQAQHNANLNKVENIEFFTGKVEEILPQLAIKPNIVILDPPRKGCQPEVIVSLRELRPRQIAYVSCNPATLARDLQLLCGDNLFRIKKIQPIDFFPQTAHVECITLLDYQGN
ncbi:MAG: 23S rRNA (uracil(1939)-C(5))-methyltransferase RlmD [Pseudanabaenaceae cyanobacterium]